MQLREPPGRLVVTLRELFLPPINRSVPWSGTPTRVRLAFARRSQEPDAVGGSGPPARGFPVRRNNELVFLHPRRQLPNFGMAGDRYLLVGQACQRHLRLPQE